MRKVALVFVLAVLVPSLVLAWLAVRSLRDQQLIVERQRYLLCQGVADKLADMAANFLSDQQAAFRDQVETLLAQKTVPEMTSGFDRQLRTNWPLAQVGFVVTTRGVLTCPSPYDSPAAQIFCDVNSKFLGNQESAQVYLNTKNASVNNPQQIRNVEPQQQSPLQQVPAQNFSKVSWSQAEFGQLIGNAPEGALARFLDNKLNVMFWYRSPRTPQLIFGAQLDPARLRESLSRLPAATELAPPLQQEICVAVLDDAARPVGLSTPGFAANWKKPFVATEIGETLPHWEAAVYLIDPAMLSKTADSLKFTLGLLIAVLVIAIGVGGWLILHCVRSELVLARQKTDFVSNVSHELKTPLTSIRMFAELMAEGRVTDAAKQRSYLNIITAEAARLTRLINNVLDFSRQERGEKKYHFQPCDLAKVARDAALTFRPHLEAAGFAFECAVPDTALPVQGDADALSQIIVNLLSNAEKYSNGRKEIVITATRAESPPRAEIKVLDRGSGVPRGSEEKVFEKFYRAHDSLSSGIEGSGLGLTIARHIARAHGGDVVYEAREGGGSCFILRIPLVPDPSMKTKILIVEDDPNILLGLEELLKSERYDVASCRRGDEALAAAVKHRPALIVLDVMLPGASGYDVCKQLRAKKFTAPIVMLTAKSQEIDKVIGLDLGADDYATKPFGVRELLARIQAALRRASTAPAKDEDEAIFQIGAATIDPKTFQLKRGKVVEELTARELKLLQFFHARAGEVLSRDKLLNEVWGCNYYGTTRTLDQVIVQLRKKLGDNGSEPRLLLTIHGVGYKLAA